MSVDLETHRVGVFLGRFQPFHLGHLNALQYIFDNNDYIIICIGSAQETFPLDIRERMIKMQFQLKEFGIPEFQKYSIAAMNDPYPMDTWVEEMVEVCGLRIWGHLKNLTLYRADDDLTKQDLKKLKKFNIKVEYIERKPFYYKADNGIYYKVSSATEIRKLVNDRVGGKIS